MSEWKRDWCNGVYLKVQNTNLGAADVWQVVLVDSVGEQLSTGTVTYPGMSMVDYHPRWSYGFAYFKTKRQAVLYAEALLSKLEEETNKVKAVLDPKKC
jgi:hypothetical protein